MTLLGSQQFWYTCVACSLCRQSVYPNSHWLNNALYCITVVWQCYTMPRPLLRHNYCERVLHISKTNFITYNWHVSQKQQTSETQIIDFTHQCASHISKTNFVTCPVFEICFFYIVVNVQYVSQRPVLPCMVFLHCSPHAMHLKTTSCHYREHVLPISKTMSHVGNICQHHIES